MMKQQIASHRSDSVLRPKSGWALFRASLFSVAHRLLGVTEGARVLAATGLLLFVACCSVQAERPNVLFIMVDDLGFSDLGCYGSEIETPNLDALAAGGLRFSQFYNTAKCHSSRVSLLTGQYCIAAGDTRMHHAVTSAEVLRDGDYFTAMTGKWHLDQQPTDFGFERYFGHLSGACNFFTGDKTFRLNGEPWSVPESGFYTTVADVDFALDFLNEARETEKPWYLYVAFNAPHAPLQALPEDYAKYEGRYDAGWDQVRAARLQRLNELGIFQQQWEPSPRPEHIPAWDSLSEARRTFEIKRMTALAGMIDRVDQEIGRLIDDLKVAGEFENTLIWFVSDNGACPYDRVSRNIDQLPTNGSVVWSDSTGWAWVRNSPFRYYKQNQFEGGISTPAVVHWPAGLKTAPGAVSHQPAHLIDVMPTLAEVTESAIPTSFEGRDLRPVSGQSLRPIFRGTKMTRQQPIHLLFASDRGLRDGDWKAVSFRSETWELYNMVNDRAELQNQAMLQPERLTSMVQKWHQMSAEVLHASGRAVAPVQQATLPHKHPEWTDFSKDPEEGKAGKAESRGAAARRNESTLPIRARKNTQLRIKAGQLVLRFSGDDPGLAFDRLPGSLPPGPYRLSFQLSSNAIGNGEVFYTTDAQTSLPEGVNQQFSVQTDGQWHEQTISLQTPKQLSKFRLDVSEGEGTATIKDLRLTAADGAVLLRWPNSR